MDKFTDEKYNVGINQEFCFIPLMKMNNILLHHMNLKNKSCSVDSEYQMQMFILNFDIDKYHLLNIIIAYLIKRKLIFGISQKSIQKHVYSSVSNILMMNFISLNITQIYLIVLIPNI